MQGARLLGTAGNGGGSSLKSYLAVGSVTERFVGGRTAPAEGYFFSRFNFIAAGIGESEFSSDKIWTFGQNLNGWIRHVFSS
jgi:hypothetical protein